MPRDRYMEPKSRSSLVKFGLVGGVQSDTDPGRVVVLDSNNVFPSPNGSEAGPRTGCEIRKRYRVTTDPPGRKAIIVETAPPDVDLGYLFMIINTNGGRNAIEAGAFVRDRTQLPFQSSSINISFEMNEVTITSFDPFNEVSGVRTANLSLDAIFYIRTRDGTAVAGAGDYEGFDTFVEVPANDVTWTSPHFVINPTAEDKFFFIDLYSPGPSVAFVPISTIVVNVNIFE